jgi:pyruvate dehydrogenase E1 component alpha subunit
VRVDGNDVLAVHAVVSAALQRVREGGGPTLVEAVTYRMGAHTTTDDPTRYRDAGEVEDWKARDPLLRVERLLRSSGVGEDFFETLDAEAAALGAAMRTAVRELPDPDPIALFDNVFAEQTDELAAQQRETQEWLDGFLDQPVREEMAR